LRDAPRTLRLPPARSWCGGDLLDIIDVHLSPLLGEDATSARHVVEMMQELPAVATALVHGDFGPHNIVWRGSRALAVLDWDHACIDDPAIDVAPLVGIYGSTRVQQIADTELLRRAMLHRATLPLQVGAAAHAVGRFGLRDHALNNFRKRLHAGVLYDPQGVQP
jgi:aminoglycoside phosphotransferase (APT) family kinase protein